MSQGAGFVHDDEILGKAYDAKLTRRLISYIGPYRREVVLAVVLLFLMAASGILPPVLAKFIIDSAIGPAVTGEIGQTEGFGRLALLGAIYVAVLAASSGFRYWQSVLTTSIGQRAMFDLRLQLFRHLQFLSLSFFDRNPVGRLMTRITNDIDALTEMVSRGVVSIFGDLFTLAAVMVVMLLLDWRLALMTFLIIPVLVGITAYFRGMMRESFRAIRIRLARVNAYLNETLSGMAIVQLFTRERQTFDQFDVLNEARCSRPTRARSAR